MVARVLFGILLTVFTPIASFAAVTPFEISVLYPLALPPGDFDVMGVRLSAVLGKNKNVYGLDLSAVGNITDQNFVGVGISGVFNVTRGSTTIIGLQLAGLTNVNTRNASVYGLQLAPINSNHGSGKIVGVDLAIFANWAPFTDIYGFQVGIYNKARDIHGLQIGLVNDCQSLHGLQIGLVNFNHRGLFAISPILNIGF